MSWGKRIREQRQKAGLSQEKVAELVGVSRQAVAKWEADLSAPSTENLFRLAQVLGTSAEFLMGTAEKAESDVLAEQVYCLHQADKAKKRQECRQKLKRSLLLALVVWGCYAIVYLAGRWLGGRFEHQTVMGWLWSQAGARNAGYVFGWLYGNELFFFSMLLSVSAAAAGLYRLGFVSFFGFGAGMLLGEWLGRNPAGASYGFGHYGWAIWGGIFLLSIGMGAMLEKWTRQGLALKSVRFRVWCGAFLIGMAVIILLVRANFYRP